MNKKNAVLLGVIMILVVASFAFTNMYTQFASSDNEFPNIETTYSRVVEGKDMSLILNFKGDIYRQGGVNDKWDDKSSEPFVKAASGWLKVLNGVKGIDKHELVINIHVNDFNGGNGAATINYDNLISQDGKYFPTEGYLVINNRLYDDSEMFKINSEIGEMSEFTANIYHEMGHIFGIGSLFVVEDNDGNILQNHISTEKTSGMGNVSYDFVLAIEAYNEVFGTSLDFLAIDDQAGHLYAPLTSGENPRSKGVWKDIKGMDYELMANGNTLTKITASLLDDLGWKIDYDGVSEYIIKD